MKLTKVIALAMAMVFTSQAMAQLSLYEKKEYITGSDTLRYRMLAPEKEVKNKKYPLVVFMHGSGERGNDNEKQLFHGAQQFVNPVNREKYQAYVMFPQCPEKTRWAVNGSKNAVAEGKRDQVSLVMDVVSKYIEEGKVDSQRIYLIGLSMGGAAVYEMITRYPHVWAVAIPICGRPNIQAIEQTGDALKRIKFRIYHGDADTTVPLENSRNAYLTLKKMGVSVEYTEFPGVTHDSWNPAFRTPGFLNWIFSVKR